MYLLVFFLQHRQRTENRLSDNTDTTVRTAASRLEFPIIPKKEKQHINNYDVTSESVDRAPVLIKSHHQLYFYVNILVTF